MSINDEYEEYQSHLLGETRRGFKKERNRRQKGDRSKRYQIPPTGSIKGEIGRVVAITPGVCHVLTTDDVLLCCHLKGLLKKEKTEHKNLVTIGDFVRFTKTDEKTGTIHSIVDRSSLLSRQDGRGKHQIIAANVNRVFIVVSIAEPPLKHSLIDRYIIAARKGRMAPVIIVNKIDLFTTKEEKWFVKELQKLYEQLSIPFIIVSAKTKKGLKAVREAMHNFTCVFSGQSGVGKTSLINAITKKNMRVRNVIEKTQKGAHTTTRATLIPLKPSGFCIDTPGIKSFGLWQLTVADVQDYFSDFAAYSHRCKYASCTHLHEPLCAVKEAVSRGHISSYRYQSYKTLIQEALDGDHL